LNDVVVIAVPYREIVPIQESHDMSPQNAAAATGAECHPVKSGLPLPRDADEPVMAEQRLPFTIRLVQSDSDLSKAVRIRQAAYARHLPNLAESLGTPEPADFENDVVVLLAESKLDGSPLGTARIQTNFHKPLSVEQSVELPDWLHGRRLAEVTRLGIGGGRIGYLVKIALIKACFEYCELNDVEWAVVAGRAPIDRQYEQLLFEDVFPGGEFIPMRHAGDIPHRVMAFEIKSGQERWTAANHPLLKFFRYTRHADIDVTRRRRRRSDRMTTAQRLSETARLM
jgi:hypothetical protein